MLDSLNSNHLCFCKGSVLDSICRRQRNNFQIWNSDLTAFIGRKWQFCEEGQARLGYGNEEISMEMDFENKVIVTHLRQSSLTIYLLLQQIQQTVYIYICIVSWTFIRNEFCGGSNFRKTLDTHRDISFFDFSPKKEKFPLNEEEKQRKYCQMIRGGQIS